jgi:hypothetical protein
MDLARLRRAPRGIARRARGLAAARELSRFRTRLAHDPEAPTLLLSPHWDDAVFDCWSLLTSDEKVRVVNVFGGVPAPGPARRWDRICGASDGAEQARRRIAEDDEALARAERKAVNLPLLDAEYREPGPDPSLKRIDEALTAVAPAASAVYAPACLGTNPDHRLLRRYARALHAHGIPVRLYADIPYCTVHGWPPWVDGAEPDPHRQVDVFWMTFLIDVPELGRLQDARVVRLDDQRAQAKLQAMRAYGTQLGALDGGPVGLLTNPAVHRFEVYWALGQDGPPAEVRG